MSCCEQDDPASKISTVTPWIPGHPGLDPGQE